MDEQPNRGRSQRCVRGLLRSFRAPHLLERDPVGAQLRLALSAPTAREALIRVVKRALEYHDPRLARIVRRCDFEGVSTLVVADELHFSRRQFFRYRALAVDAIAFEIERILAQPSWRVSA